MLCDLEVIRVTKIKTDDLLTEVQNFMTGQEKGDHLMQMTA
jgi:hypothetical protein